MAKIMDPILPILSIRNIGPLFWALLEVQVDSNYPGCPSGRTKLPTYLPPWEKLNHGKAELLIFAKTT